MIIANILVGLALLILGKKLFWLFVGAIGFIGASDMAARYFSGLPDWQILIITVAAGLVGVLLAILFKRWPSFWWVFIPGDIWLFLCLTR